MSIWSPGPSSPPNRTRPSAKLSTWLGLCVASLPLILTLNGVRRSAKKRGLGVLEYMALDDEEALSALNNIEHSLQRVVAFVQQKSDHPDEATP